MTPRFARWIEFALRPDHEGHYSDDPKDPGRETNFGVSKRSYPNLPIALLTRDEAIAIHYRDRWLPIRGDELPEGLAFLVAEAAMNQGTETAVRLLQEEINEQRRRKATATRPADVPIDVDGDLGPQTLAAVRATEPKDLIDRYAGRRAWRYEINPNEIVYGKGWFRRLMRAHRAAVTTA